MNRHLATVVALALVMLAALVPVAAAQDEAAGDGRPVEDPLFGVASVVPAEWREQGGGLYARGTPPEDLAVLAIQSAPASPDQVWTSLLPQLGLDEAPEPTGELVTDRFDWTLYRVDVPLGAQTIAAEVALAEDEGTTYLVLLQSVADEFAVLREQVLVPAIEAFRVLEPEPTPDPATLGYAVEEVSFPGGGEGVELAGTLTLPEGAGPHPGVVLMSGSGAQDRDESLRPVSTLKPFALIADALTSAGVAVLRYDDRGVGGSTGDYEAATVQELASDGAAALAYLETRADIDPERTGVLGHSEGGLYAAMLGAADERIDFIVAMAPPAAPGVELLIAQTLAILRSQGEAEAEIELAAAFAESVYPSAADGDAAGVGEAVRTYYGAFWDRQGEDDQVLLGEREAFVELQIEMLVPLYTSDWFRSLLAYDPAPDWRQVGVPVLGLFGALDVQVPLEQNEPALRAALEAAGNEDVAIEVFPDANHLFQAAETGAIEEYGELPPEFTPDFLPTLVAWVTEQVGLGGPTDPADPAE